jgi:hypothetical protein
LPIKNRLAKLKVVLTIALLLTISSCSVYKKPALGPDNEIYVLADETIFDTHYPQLESIFSHSIYTPTEEKLFTLNRITIDEFHKGFSRYKNLILLANIDSDDAEAQFIKKMLTDGVLEGVRSGDYYYAVKKDAWSKGQTVLFLLDSKNVYLSGYLERFSDKLFGFFYDKMVTDIKTRLFDRFNNKTAQEFLLKEYKINLFIPHEFYIGEQGENKDKFIRFRRTNPDRWLTLLRTDYNSEISFQENIIQTRDRIGKQFADSVRVNPEILSFVPDTTFVSDGLKAQGIWEYYDGGGPFFTYAFINNGTFYMIDGAVFAPSKDKYPYIMQLDLMAKTAKFPEIVK